MNGVMIPGVSAGSNHVGASETWTAHVSCPSAGAALARGASVASQRTSTTAMTPRAGLMTPPASSDHAIGLETLQVLRAQLQPLLEDLGVVLAEQRSGRHLCGRLRELHRVARHGELTPPRMLDRSDHAALFEMR